MVADLYESLLLELAKALKIGELHPDSNNSCLIRLQNGFEVQIEPDSSGQSLLIGAEVAPLPPGRFRINVFKEALKSNGLPAARRGIFAWSRKADMLVLFALLPLKNLNGDKIASFLMPFSATAITWRDTIKAGQIPVVDASWSQKSSSAMFGL